MSLLLCPQIVRISLYLSRTSSWDFVHILVDYRWIKLSKNIEFFCFCLVENPVQARLSTLNVSFSILRQSLCLLRRKRRQIIKWRWALKASWQAVLLVVGYCFSEREEWAFRFTCVLFNRGLWRIKSSKPTLCWKLLGMPRLWGTTTPLALWVSLIWFTKNLLNTESKMLLFCWIGKIHSNTLWHNW